MISRPPTSVPDPSTTPSSPAGSISDHPPRPPLSSPDHLADRVERDDPEASSLDDGPRLLTTEVETERSALGRTLRLPRHRRVAVPPRRERLVEPIDGHVVLPTPRPPIPWARLVLGTVVTILVLGPLVLLAVNAGKSDWIPGGDRAVIEMHVRDVGSHTPLVGPYSRYGWNHPGPLSYWVLAIPYRVLGSTSSALLAGTAVLNVVSIAGTLAIAWRRGRLPLLAMTAVAISILCRSLLPETLADPWNPFVTVLPLLLFVALGWTLREGDRWAAPLLILVGSFLVQSHVGYLGIVAMVVLWAAFGWARERWLADADAVTGGENRSRGRRLLRAIRPGPAVASCLVVLALLWAPVVIDQVNGSHNLTQVAKYFSTTSEEPPVGTAYAVGVVTRHVTGLPAGEGASRPPWLGGDEPVDPYGGGEVPVNPIWLALAAAAYIVIGAAVRRQCRRDVDSATQLRDGSALRLQLLVGLCAAMAVVSIARVTGVVYNYLILWLPVLAMLVWLATAWSVWCLATRQGRRWPRALPAVRVAGAVGVVAALSWSTQVFLGGVNDFRSPEGYHRDPVMTLSPATIAATPRGGPVLIDSAGGGATNMTDGIRLQLERADRPTVSRHEDAYKFGADRDASTSKPVTQVWVVSGDAIVDWAKRDDVRQVAIWDPLPTAQRAKYFEDVEVLRNQLLAVHRMDLFDALYGGGSLFPARGLKGIDQDLLTRIEDLRGKGRPVAVFVGSAPTA